MKEDKLKKYYYLALYILGIRGSLLVNIINNFTLQDIRKLFFSKEMFELAFKYDISLDKYSNIFSDDRKLYESLIMAMNIEAQHKMLGIETIPINDVRYPNKLRIIKNAPPIVYISGALLSEKEKAIGCVGGKDISDFGKRAINSLVSNLVRDGYRIVSSLDKGADKTIIERCIECGGRPIVVLPYGLTKTYYKKDLERIAFISEGNTHIHNLNDLDCPLCGAKTITEDIMDYDKSYKELYDSINGAYYQLQDNAATIADQLENLDFDEDRLDNIQKRLITLDNLKKKYGTKILLLPLK